MLIVNIERPTHGFIVESQRRIEKAREWMLADPPAAIDRQIFRARSLPLSSKGLV